MLETGKDMDPQSREIFQTFAGGGGVAQICLVSMDFR